MNGLDRKFYCVCDNRTPTSTFHSSKSIFNRNWNFFVKALWGFWTLNLCEIFYFRLVLMQFDLHGALQLTPLTPSCPQCGHHCHCSMSSGCWYHFLQNLGDLLDWPHFNHLHMLTSLFAAHQIVRLIKLLFPVHHCDHNNPCSKRCKGTLK